MLDSGGGEFAPRVVRDLGLRAHDDLAADAHGFFAVAGAVEASAGGRMSRGSHEPGRNENVDVDEHTGQRPSPDKSSDPPVRRPMSS